jgi:hypothetical protein
MKTKSRLLLTACGVLAVAFNGATFAAPAEIDPVNPPKTARVPVKTNGATSTKAPREARLSAGLDDILKLTQAGVDETVILAFIESSPVAYRPSAPEILKLRELGISPPVISALLRRGEEVRKRAADAQREAAARNAAQTPPAPAVSDPPPQQPQQPQPATPPPCVNYTPVVYPVAYPTVVYASYPTYRYSPVVSFGSRHCYYPRSYYSYSCYPRGRSYGGFYSRSSLSIGFRGGYFRGYGGFRHCR